jgi:hypothetical protein
MRPTPKDTLRISTMPPLRFGAGGQHFTVINGVDLGDFTG